MSSNKTVIPGLGGQYQSVQNSGAQPLSQTFSPQQTAIPGAQPFPGVAPVPQQESKGQVFGFLFSVSKTMAGEYWPLMLGANTLGRGAQNSIVLGEATVSESHASIHVISRSNKLIVYIKDDASKTGTLLNGELLRGEADLKSGDIITVGECYELYVLLINAVELGLGVKESFVSVNPSVAAPFIPQAQPGMPSPFMPSPSQPAKMPSVGTIVEGQSGPAPMGGHTVIMGGPQR